MDTTDPAAVPRAALGRRVVALALDWLACSLVSRLVAPAIDWGTQASGALVLLIFFLEVTVLTWLTGASFGQRLVGLSVIGLDPGILRRLLGAAVRTLLICLVIPAVIMDQQGRGLHDRAVGTYVVRARQVSATRVG